MIPAFLLGGASGYLSSNLQINQLHVADIVNGFGITEIALLVSRGFVLNKKDPYNREEMDRALAIIYLDEFEGNIAVPKITNHKETIGLFIA